MRIAALLLAVLLVACGQGAALDRLAPTGHAVVAEAASGDEVILDSGERVQLAGLASMPERAPYGAEARALLEKLTAGQEVELLSGGAPEDPFSRRVAHLRLTKGRVWVQGEMLEAGAAQVRTFADNRALAAEMLELEARARIAKRGLWALEDYRVLLAHEARLAHGFQIIEGRVREVRQLGPAVVLDIDGLRAEIPARAVADFEAAGKTPEDLSGRLVRIRGGVRQGPSMRLDHPEMLEVLEVLEEAGQSAPTLSVGG